MPISTMTAKRTGGQMRRLQLRPRDVLWLFPVLPAMVFGLLMLWPVQDARVHAFTVALLPVLAAISAIDARRMIVPDGLVLVLALSGTAATFVFNPDALVARLLAAFGAMVGLWLFAEIFRRLRGQEGLGFGDIKFVAAAVLWIGLEGLPSMILMGSLTALFAALVLMAVRGRLTRLPFAPHLAAGLWIVWCCGPLAL
jgi:leader peptidase (prepilin peptidase) / N-methyltransferase